MERKKRWKSMAAKLEKNGEHLEDIAVIVAAARNAKSDKNEQHGTDTTLFHFVINRMQ